MATTDQLRGNAKAEQVRDYLLAEASSEGEYFKSRFIAEDLDLTAHEIGAAILKLQSECPELDIEDWSYTSGTTWLVSVRGETA